MAFFDYRAVNKSGRKLKGKIDAANIKQAISQLQAQDLFIVSIHSTKKQLDAASQKKKQFREKAVPSPIITAFTRQFSVLTSTGVPYNSAMKILIQECEHPKFQHVLSAMKSQIMEGSSLAQALQAQPDIFSGMYVALVKAGEAGGTLSGVLERLATSRESNEDLASKIKGALIYPLVLFIVALGIIIFMVTFLLPKIAPIFSQFNVALPLPTRLVIAVSDFIMAQWIPLIVLIIACIVLFKKLLATDIGTRIKDRLYLKMPVLGRVIKKIVIFRFTQTLGTLLSSGVELKQSLSIVRNVMGNRVFEDIFDTLITDITKKGMDLSQALRKTELFPPSVTQMIRIGEEASQLESMLEKISDILEKEVRQTIEKAVALLEPLTILWMASVVGFIILAIMLPLFEINRMI